MLITLHSRALKNFHRIAILLEKQTKGGNDFSVSQIRSVERRASETRCNSAGKGKRLIINSSFWPCFTACKDSKRINFGRACEIAVTNNRRRTL